VLDSSQRQRRGMPFGLGDGISNCGFLHLIYNLSL
jgi:hypothetical protein